MLPLKLENSRSTDLAENADSCLGAVYMFLLSAARRHSMDSEDADNGVLTTVSTDVVSAS
jgi:hypothetical protein